MKRVLKTGLATVIVAASLSLNAAAESITIATVNNGDMIRMQKLTDDFKKEKGTFSFFKWCSVWEIRHCCFEGFLFLYSEKFAVKIFLEYDVGRVVLL